MNFTTVYTSETDGRRILSDRHLQEENLVDTNTYKKNKAAYAEDMASYPGTFKYTLLQNGFLFTSDDVYDGATFAPGQLIDL